MQVKQTECCFLFMLLIFGVFAFIAYGGRYFTKHKQTKVLAGSVMSESKANSGMFCSYQCSQVDGCQSVSFNDATRDCLLSETTTSKISDHSVSDAEWTTFSMYEPIDVPRRSSSTTCAQAAGPTTATTASSSTTLTTPTSTAISTITIPAAGQTMATTASMSTTSMTTSTETTKTSTKAPTEGDIRLLRGQDSSYGCLEIYHNSTWRQVGGANKWTWKMTKTACRQMGYNYGGSYHDSSAYGRGSGWSVLLRDINCTGTETKLTDCGITDYVTLTSHGQDLGLTCYTENIESGFIRLRSPDGDTGADVMSGIAEVKFNNTWGSICGFNWKQWDSALFCLGLDKDWTVGSQCTENCAIHGDGPIWMTDVRCEDKPPNIFYCKHNGWGIEAEFRRGYKCTHDKDVNIECVHKA